MSVDLLIRGGTVFDGTPRRPVRADLAVQGSSIVAVGDDQQRAGAREVLDVDGLAVAPGFIDMHSHADFTLPTFPEAVNSISQGVTTEVVGNCGFSPAPVSSNPSRARELHNWYVHVEPDVAGEWRSFGEFMNFLDRRAPPVNVIPLVGHGTLRMYAMGLDQRPATPGEIAAMRAALAEALRDGAWGMSSGLVYPPGASADTRELIELAHELRLHQAMYASHVRSEAAEVVDAIEEALRIGEQAHVAVQVSHLKVIGKAQHGRMAELLALLDASRGRGAQVTADAYPYVAGSAPLVTMLPPWIQAIGVKDMVELLRSEEVRRRIRSELESGLPGWDDELETVGGWDGLMLTHVASPRFAWTRGLRVSVAAERNAAMTGGSTDPLTFALDLLVEDLGATWIVGWGMCDADMRAALTYPWTTIGSDQAGVLSADSRVHPRSYGAFARVLGWAVREADLFSLGEAVYKITGLAADALGLADRGRIAPGLAADIVVFDPRTVADHATFDDPTRPATGIEFVLVNGQLAIAQGKVTGRRSGKVLRKSPRDRGDSQCQK